MERSRLIAKLAVRTFLIFLLAALSAVIINQGKLQHVGYINLYQWRMIFPVLLIAGFITLLILCTVKKYRVADLNWLLVINTVTLMAYGVAISLRIAQLMH
ncbi:hypothetical protein HH214_16775 [Mucilaginibacter robiniae]|uniref:Uncharacterized protein n=1 Tax=Mucilaginibacter robiniae TaxID=2728022 RepID=A0A7L5E2P9_9SPHI|nr:hypothetical protein [Mucilaginibacter robiniae]QJD97405.1 hypothetical protein HH214_16775 [Mucilaginibacter robiniae]